MAGPVTAPLFWPDPILVYRWPGDEDGLDIYIEAVEDEADPVVVLVQGGDRIAAPRSVWRELLPELERRIG